MVFFGHAGITLGAGWAARTASRSPGGPDGLTSRVAGTIRDNLDLRWLVVGSMLPDIIDKPFMLLGPDNVIGSGRAIAHSLAFMIALLLAGLMARRKARAVLLTLLAGSLAHLALDGMWQMPHTLLWPLLGWDFQRIDVGPLAPHLLRALTAKPLTYVPEAIGFAISVAFGLRLLFRHKIRSFFFTGKV